jgi:hypothetical protein
VFAALRRKTIREWSFGYIVTQAKAIAHGAKEIFGVDIIELGPCAVGVGDTATLAVKGVTAADVADRARRRAQLARYEQQLAAASRRFQLARAGQQLAAHHAILETISTTAVRNQQDHRRRI